MNCESGVAVKSITLLRAFASLSVCWFHLTNGNSSFLADGFLKSSGRYGWLGVEIFFIVSGFIIPWSLSHSNYHVENFPRFMAKRIIRLEPPYLLSILLIIFLNYLSTLSPLYKGKTFLVNIPSLLLHLGYLNAFFNYDWLNPIFWSLAIEFQYYLLIGSFYIFVAHKSALVRILSMICLIACFSLFGHAERLMARYIPLFVLGILTFQKKIGLINWIEFATFFLPSLYFCRIYQTLMPLLAGATVIVILFVDFETKITNFFGNISYSLYLLHIPIGGRVINLLARFAGDISQQVLVLILALVVSILCAYLFYLAVEKPSQKFSKIIHYAV